MLGDAILFAYHSVFVVFSRFQIVWTAYDWNTMIVWSFVSLYTFLFLRPNHLGCFLWSGWIYEFCMSLPLCMPWRQEIQAVLPVEWSAVIAMLRFFSLPACFVLINQVWSDLLSADFLCERMRLCLHYLSSLLGLKQGIGVLNSKKVSELFSAKTGQRACKRLVFFFRYLENWTGLKSTFINCI